MTRMNSLRIEELETRRLLSANTTVPSLLRTDQLPLTAESVRELFLQRSNEWSVPVDVRENVLSAAVERLPATQVDQIVGEFGDVSVQLDAIATPPQTNPPLPVTSFDTSLQPTAAIESAFDELVQEASRILNAWLHRSTYPVETRLSAWNSFVDSRDAFIQQLRVWLGNGRLSEVRTQPDTTSTGPETFRARAATEVKSTSGAIMDFAIAPVQSEDTVDRETLVSMRDDARQSFGQPLKWFKGDDDFADDARNATTAQWDSDSKPEFRFDTTSERTSPRVHAFASLGSLHVSLGKAVGYIDQLAGLEWPFEPFLSGDHPAGTRGGVLGGLLLIAAATTAVGHVSRSRRRGNQVAEIEDMIEVDVCQATVRRDTSQLML
ncbi:MAG: hypothetical protein AAFU85_34395 [Planctomycetota bacterium]